MSKITNPKLLIARYYNENGEKKTVSIADYHLLENNKDQKAIAEFVYFRLYSRYLKPFQYPDLTFKKCYQNSFSIMSACCLLIETLESFKQGLNDSNGKSGRLFTDFLGTDKNFTEFVSKETEFYKNVRCGILHQGETTEGYILCKTGTILFEQSKSKINAVLFANRLQQSLIDYKDALIAAPWNDALWNNLRAKMSFIISNCAK